MRSTSAAIFLAAGSLLSLTSATGTLKLGITREREVGSSQSLRRRAGTVSAPLTEDGLFIRYYADVTIGTPGQALKLVVDTGSSDVWAVASSASICSTKGCPQGTFDSAKSSTFSDNGPGRFQDKYADGTSTTGDYFQDAFGIGGATVKAFQMGLGLTSSIEKGVLGISFNTLEGGGTVRYPNLVDSMVNQSIIATQAYSLWLDDLDARSGSLLFGGIDTAKFTGPLANIAMYPSSDTHTIDRFTVSFTSLTLTSPSGSDTLTPSGYAKPVVLDSGTTLSYLPDDLTQAIYNEVGAIYVSEIKAAVCHCGIATASGGSLTFGFAGPNGPTIKVPISEMVYPLLGTDGTQASFSSGEPACLFGIEPASILGSTAPLLFGDTLLRSAYVVYDLANFRIGLAQTKFNSTDSNVVAFPSLNASIPSATTVSNEVAVTQTASKGNIGVETAIATAGVATYGVAATSGLFTGNAGPGFQSATAAAKKNGAGGMVQNVVVWEQVVVVGLTMSLMGIGGIMFFL